MQGNELNILIFWVCAALGAIVYAVIIWSLIAYRKKKKQEVAFHKSTMTEIAWTVVPLIIIIAMMIPTANLLTRLYSDESAANNLGMTPVQDYQLRITSTVKAGKANQVI